MFLSFPYQFDEEFKTKVGQSPRNIRELIEQVIFVAPQERLNRPDFGVGILQYIFAPNSEYAAETLEGDIESALTLWLSEILVVEDVTVRAEESTLFVRVSYRLSGQSEVEVEEFTREGMS
jgi:phage baseplate assembly protein W